VYVTAIDFIVRVAAHLKHERYAHEQEVRLYGRAELTGAEVFFRTRNKVIIPYIKIKADGQDHRLPLLRINVGHGVDFDMAEIGVKTALRRNGFAHLPVENKAGSRR